MIIEMNYEFYTLLLDGKSTHLDESAYHIQLEEECKNKRSVFVAALKETITEDDLVQVSFHHPFSACDHT